MSYLIRKFVHSHRWVSALLVSLAMGATLFVAPTSASAATGCTTTLRVGSHGACVVQLQNSLNKAGFVTDRFGADGSYGSGTKNTVIAFQRYYKLAPDGVYGPKTRAALTKHAVAPSALFAHLNGKNRSGVVFVADKSDRKVYAFRDGKYLFSAKARFGGKVWDAKKKIWITKNTPTGAFWVQAKIKDGYSNKYEAKMPYFTVFNGDIGFHFSALYRAVNYGPDGTYGSHGCVNIGNMMDASRIFNLARVGYTRVYVQK